MQHAREDYDRIQDPAGLIPADEPVFLLRGQDAVAPKVVRLWADLIEEAGGSQAIVEAARNQAAEMDDWQREHGAKLADMPEGA